MNPELNICAQETHTHTHTHTHTELQILGTLLWVPGDSVALTYCPMKDCPKANQLTYNLIRSSLNESVTIPNSIERNKSKTDRFTYISVYTFIVIESNIFLI